MASDMPFDPFTQSFTLQLGDGTPFNVSMPELDDFIIYSVQICINYASQLGASCILLIALLLLTQPDKRRSPVFFLNLISLALNVIRNVLQCLYFTGPFSKTYAYFGQDFSRVPTSAYATSIAATVLAVLLLICIQASLLLQIRAVCVILRDLYRQAIFAFSAIIALLAIGFRLALCIENSRSIISLEPPTSLNWLESASNITTSISICWFCAVFVTKLAFALNERRKLGLKRFGPMQIIFIMGCQTLIIPAIFSILQYLTTIPAMSSNALTLVTLFLPLSSLWASASLHTHSPNDKKPAANRRQLFGSFTIGSSSRGPLINEKILQSPSSSMAAVTRASQVSTVPSPVKAGEDGVYRDLEAQDMAFRDTGAKMG